MLGEHTQPQQSNIKAQSHFKQSGFTGSKPKHNLVLPSIAQRHKCHGHAQPIGLMQIKANSRCAWEAHPAIAVQHQSTNPFQAERLQRFKIKARPLLALILVRPWLWCFPSTTIAGFDCGQALAVVLPKHNQSITIVL